MRNLTTLERQLREDATLDVTARQAALVAVDDMMRAATRAGALLSQARVANVAAATHPNSPAAQNRAALARAAYEERTNAEVAKYRAVYALLAEMHGQEGVGASQMAQQAMDAQAQRPFVAAAKHHGKVRDLMLQASAAAGKALKMVPPLPYDVAPMARIGPEANVAQGHSTELLAQPTFGWRPKKYSELMGDFFPMNYRLAAGALSGVHGVSVGSQFGTADATANMPTGESWWNSLQKAIGYGAKAAGEAATAEGQKKAEQDPTGAGVLQTGGNILNVLSAMLGAGVDQGMQQPTPAQTDWGSVALVVGGLALGGFALWKLTQ
ncbi:MAG: hypothetical protein EPN91_08570 [Salinibacterium sp.]|nr:MAG: hypothetical protein EPN91_08570 [Salinibacterium sp.]